MRLNRFLKREKYKEDKREEESLKRETL